MRVRPTRGPNEPGAIFGAGLEGAYHPPDVASDVGQIIQPWLASGGATSFPHLDGEGGDELGMCAVAGTQLICAYYVGPGMTGFVKELMAFPLCPPQLAAQSVPVSWPVWDDGEPIAGTVRAAAVSGYYDTPLGWESNFNADEGGAGTPPSWQWHVRLIQGDVLRDRPPFNPADATTWFLQLNVPVPSSAYQNGLPGQAPWQAQRVQVGPREVFETHLVVREDTTICLFATWTQVSGAVDAPTPAFFPQQQFSNLPGGPPTIVGYGPAVFPLLPSVGRLHGYIQAAARESTVANATYGWGG